MVQKDILVSVLINNYNNQNFLKKSIDSCLNQTYKNLKKILQTNSRWFKKIY